MDSSTPLNPELPEATRNALMAGVLDAEAEDLKRRAEAKERTAATGPEGTGKAALLKDAAIFRSEAASKRAKAEGLRKEEANTTKAGA